MDLFCCQRRIVLSHAQEQQGEQRFNQRRKLSHFAFVMLSQTRAYLLLNQKLERRLVLRAVSSFPSGECPGPSFVFDLPFSAVNLVLPILSLASQGPFVLPLAVKRTLTMASGVIKMALWRQYPPALPLSHLQCLVHIPIPLDFTLLHHRWSSVEPSGSIHAHVPLDSYDLPYHVHSSRFSIFSSFSSTLPRLCPSVGSTNLRDSILSSSSSQNPVKISYYAPSTPSVAYPTSECF